MEILTGSEQHRPASSRTFLVPCGGEISTFMRSTLSTGKSTQRFAESIGPELGSPRKCIWDGSYRLHPRRPGGVRSLVWLSGVTCHGFRLLLLQENQHLDVRNGRCLLRSRGGEE
eukprot:scaffold3957_cov157-Pinguiococcus_pyrenoidosus.AAC.3